MGRNNSSDFDRKGIKTPMVFWPLDFRDLHAGEINKG